MAQDLNKWTTINAILISISALISTYFNQNNIVLYSILLSTVYLFSINWKQLQEYTPILGYANWITLFRLVLNTVLFWKFIELKEDYLLIGFTISILLDGADGWVARHYVQSSDWGALFDKSTDALLVLYLSIILYQKEYVGSYLLGIGCLPYFYELLIFTLGWRGLVIPKNPIGKYVAALLFFTLLSPFVIDLVWAKNFILLSTMLTLLSFCISFFYKWKTAQLLKD